MANFVNLREANVARQKEWGFDDLPLSFRAMEMAGEIGEVLEELLTDSSELSLVNIGHELADVVICADLVAHYSNAAPWYGLPIVSTEYPFMGTTKDAAYEMAMAGGLACNIAKKLERERLGIEGSRAGIGAISEPLRKVMGLCLVIANRRAVSLSLSIPDKFNIVSKKVGLTTRLLY